MMCGLALESAVANRATLALYIMGLNSCLFAVTKYIIYFLIHKLFQKSAVAVIILTLS